MTGSRGSGQARRVLHRFGTRTTVDRHRRPAPENTIAGVVGKQRQSRNLKYTRLSAQRVTGVLLPRRNDMSSMIEDLARDRMRQIQRDAEMTRRARRARALDRAARSART